MVLQLNAATSRDHWHKEAKSAGTKVSSIYRIRTRCAGIDYLSNVNASIESNSIGHGSIEGGVLGSLCDENGSIERMCIKWTRIDSINVDYASD